MIIALQVLGMLFALLKWIDAIDWPWLWVLAPWWGTYLLLGPVLIIALLIALARR